MGTSLREVAAGCPIASRSSRACPTRGPAPVDLRRAAARRGALRAALLTRFEPGERIAVWAHNLPEWVILEYGAALAGMTLVTVNPSFQPAEVAYVLGQSEVGRRVPRPRGPRQPARRPRRADPRRPARAAPGAPARPARRARPRPHASGQPLPAVGPTTRPRSSTPAAPRAFRRAPCCTTAASSTTPAVGRPRRDPRRRGLAEPDAPVPHRRLRAGASSARCRGGRPSCSCRCSIPACCSS